MLADWLGCHGLKAVLTEGFEKLKAYCPALVTDLVVMKQLAAYITK